MVFIIIELNLNKYLWNPKIIHKPLQTI